MAKPTDQYCIQRFFEVFPRFGHEERKGILAGLRGVDVSMRANPTALPLVPMTLFDDGQQEPDSEGGEA